MLSFLTVALHDSANNAFYHVDILLYGYSLIGLICKCFSTRSEITFCLPN